AVGGAARADAAAGGSYVGRAGRPSDERPRSLLVALELALVDLVLGDLVGDAAPRQPADSGALAHLPARLAQGLAQVALLEGGRQLGQLLRQRPAQIDLHRALALAPSQHVGRQVTRLDDPLPRRDAGALDSVLQLADVAGPVEAQQRLHRLAADLRRALVG